MGVGELLYILNIQIGVANILKYFVDIGGLAIRISL
jgi:hypothetical protein